MPKFSAWIYRNRKIYSWKRLKRTPISLIIHQLIWSSIAKWKRNQQIDIKTSIYPLWTFRLIGATPFQKHSVFRVFYAWWKKDSQFEWEENIIYILKTSWLSGFNDWAIVIFIKITLNHHRNRYLWMVKCLRVWPQVENTFDDEIQLCSAGQGIRWFLARGRCFFGDCKRVEFLLSWVGNLKLEACLKFPLNPLNFSSHSISLLLLIS